MKILVEKKSLFEMANLSKEETQLPFDLWLDSAGVDRNTPHSNTPRLKIYNKGEEISILISESPKILAGSQNVPKIAKVFAFIRSSATILKNHYFKRPGYTDRATLNALVDVANGMSEEASIKKNISAEGN